MLAALALVSMTIAVDGPLVRSSHMGLCIAPDVICMVSQRGVIEDSNAFVLQRQWCNYAGMECYDENGNGCTTEECLAVWTVYTPIVSYPQWIRPQAGVPAHYNALDINLHNEQGLWIGPADWLMDGLIDSQDYFAFNTAFFEGDADYDLDGVTSSADYFLFLNDFFGE